MADWSDLPHDLLILIAKRVKFLEDFIAFGKVCTSWRFAATKNNYTNTFPQIPWLFITQEQSTTSQLQKFLTLKNLSTLHKVILPKPTYEFLYFSSLGWFLAHENISNIYLLHPVSRAQITLPTIPHNGYYAGYKFGDITKFVLSDSPSVTNCNYLVMLAFGCLGLLAFCRPGDASFTTTKKWGAQIFDVTYFDNKLYGVDAVGRVFICDIDGPNPTKMRFVMDMGVDVERGERLYILELQGRLVVVLRKWQVGETYFRVFEINLMEQRWFEMKNIGDMAIFLGLNSSFAVEACEEVHGCTANCIYFTSDYFDVLKHPISSGTQREYNLLNGRVTGARDFGKGASATWIEPSF